MSVALPRHSVEGQVADTVSNGWYESEPLSGSQMAAIEAEIIASATMRNPMEIVFPRYNTMDHHLFKVLPDIHCIIVPVESISRSGYFLFCKGSFPVIK